MGDDCCVLPEIQSEILASVDSVIYEVHFDKSISPKDVGKKLVKRNLSDIAAMGAEPMHCLISVIANKKVSIKWFEQFAKAIKTECKKYNLQINGGDLAQTKQMDFSSTMTIIGKKPISKTNNQNNYKILLRKGAKIGDYIFVTGTLGGSISKKHYAFTPRIKEGIFLAKQDVVKSCIDITDGIKKDLVSILPKNSMAKIFTKDLPFSKEAKKKKNPINSAFCDGEDYELLFSVDKNANLETFIKNWKSQKPKLAKITCIGQILQSKSKYNNNDKNDLILFVDENSEEIKLEKNAFLHF